MKIQDLRQLLAQGNYVEAVRYLAQPYAYPKEADLPYDGYKAYLRQHIPKPLQERWDQACEEKCYWWQDPVKNRSLDPCFDISMMSAIPFNWTTVGEDKDTGIFFHAAPYFTAIQLIRCKLAYHLGLEEYYNVQAHEEWTDFFEHNGEGDTGLIIRVRVEPSAYFEEATIPSHRGNLPTYRRSYARVIFHTKPNISFRFLGPDKELPPPCVHELVLRGNELNDQAFLPFGEDDLYHDMPKRFAFNTLRKRTP